MVALYRTYQFCILCNLFAVIRVLIAEGKPITSVRIVPTEAMDLITSTENTPSDPEGDLRAKVETIHLLFDLSTNPDDIHFFLYNDPNNPNVSQELIFNDNKSFSRSLFNPQAKTVFLIHGFWTNGLSPMPTAIKNDPPNPLYAPVSYYAVVKRSIPLTFNRVSDFIRFMLTSNYATIDNIHLIGFSLGAHVAGGVGRTIATFPEIGKKLGRVTGLDPAGPLFSLVEIQGKLTKGDAEFVDTYHTAAGSLGISNFTDGHVNFIVNEGHHQPGCVENKALYTTESQLGSCSHGFAPKIFAASIAKNFTACNCSNVVTKTEGCQENCTVTVLAGERCPTSARGQFAFETSENPFAD
ncbi:unnamed protein product [Orchesella dallaii]|uniref:Lipase domain-containing protein n=1 Tax=Orchesella dallaii TaxID=48710 RepID=A0ABP1QI84_9HEXA